MAADHFCLRWNNYQSNMVSELDILRTEEHLVDVTLCCEGHKFRAHKVILSACSPYFRNVFKENPCEHPVVILKDVSHEDVDALLSFVYQGVVYVSEKKLSSFLQTAELLQIKGLAGAASSFNEEQAKLAAATPQSPAKRRKSAPVRIVKQEDGDTSSEIMDPEDENLKNDFTEETMDKTQDDDVSMEEESENENCNDVNLSSYAEIDMRGNENERQRLTNIPRNEQVSSLIQQTLARQRGSLPSQMMDNSMQNQYQGSVQSATMQELLSPAVERNGRRPCPLCTKVISNKSNLLKHMRIRHSDVYNPACCVLCNKIFKNKYSLKAHLNIYHKQYIPSSQTPPVQPTQPPENNQYMPGVYKSDDSTDMFCNPNEQL